MSATPTPEETAAQLVRAGVGKARAIMASTVVLAVMAGAFVALGAMLTSTIGAQSTLGAGPTRLIMGLGLTMGLFFVVVTGAELFTGNNLMVMSVLSRTILARELARNWALVYVGNLIGALVVVLLVFYSRWWEQGDFSFSEFSVTSADGKVSLPFGIAFLRGIVANMLVCLAVWMATAGRTVTDKLLAVSLPVTAFVAGGFEHSVANMFFLPFGALVATEADALAAAGLTAADVARLDIAGIARNLVAVTLGNIVGGVIVGLADWTVHLRRRAVAAAAETRGGSAPGLSASSRDTPS
ncbi:MAG: formate/nitrite transporter family protein [Acidimicrobiaceae bacterium]|nr:formate/nitrite transporter family protein [Acidimicrobiaceae bacterium]